MKANKWLTVFRIYFCSLYSKMMFQITSLTAFQILLFCCIVIGKYNDPSKVKVAQIFVCSNCLCVTQKALQLPLFSSFYFSLQQIWTDGWKWIVDEVAQFRHTEKYHATWELSVPIWSFNGYRMIDLGLLPLMTEISVFMPLQAITPGNSWLTVISLKDTKL